MQGNATCEQVEGGGVAMESVSSKDVICLGLAEPSADGRDSGTGLGVFKSFPKQYLSLLHSNQSNVQNTVRSFTTIGFVSCPSKLPTRVL